jgi:hypothetical protein
VDHWRYLRRKAYGTAEVRVLAQRVLIGDISDSRLYGRHGKKKVSRSRISAELGEISAMVKIALTDISGKEIAVGEYSSRVAELFRVTYRCKRGSSCRLMCNNLLLKPTMTVSCLDPSDVNQVTVVWLRDFQKKSYAKAFAAIKDDGSVVTWRQQTLDPLAMMQQSGVVPDGQFLVLVRRGIIQTAHCRWQLGENVAAGSCANLGEDQQMMALW